MINKINAKMDSVVKGLSLLFTFCIFIGTIVIWVYFNSAGLSGEISSVLSSPQVLLMIALYSIFSSIGFFIIVILTPVIINFCEKGPEVEWNKSLVPLKAFFMRLVIVLLPLLVFLLAAWLGVKEKYFLYCYFFVCFLMAYLFYWFHGGPVSLKLRNKINNFSVVLFSLIIIYGLLVFCLNFFLEVTQFFVFNQEWQWLVLFLLIVVYSLVVAVADKNSSSLSYVPLVILSLIILVYLFASSGLDNIASKLGLGGFYSSYAVNVESIAAIEEESYKFKKTESKNVVILKDVWVVANLPNKIIVSASQEFNTIYSLPRSAIIGEINSVNKVVKNAPNYPAN